MVHGTSPHHFFLETFSTYPPARLASNTITANAKKIPVITLKFLVLDFFLCQGQCKPNAESSLYAEVQPVLAFLVPRTVQTERRELALC